MVTMLISLKLIGRVNWHFHSFLLNGHLFKNGLVCVFVAFFLDKETICFSDQNICIIQTDAFP